MKRTTRNNIVRYAISAIFVVMLLSIICLVNIGLEWLTDKTGLPIYPVVCIICLVYIIWYVGSNFITDKSDGE